MKIIWPASRAACLSGSIAVAPGVGEQTDIQLRKITIQGEERIPGMPCLRLRREDIPAY